LLLDLSLSSATNEPFPAFPVFYGKQDLPKNLISGGRYHDPAFITTQEKMDENDRSGWGSPSDSVNGLARSGLYGYDWQMGILFDNLCPRF
jgi:hypothetical protein